MKKVIFGSLLCASGTISAAIILASAMTHEWINDGAYSVMWNLSRYGATPFLILFVVIAIIGLIVAIRGLYSRE